MKRRSFLIGGTALVGSAIITKPSGASHTMRHAAPKVSQIVSHETFVATAHGHRHKHHKKPVYPQYTRHKPLPVKLSKYDHDVLVKTIWGETRGEDQRGRMAVVHVILNRKYRENPFFKKSKSISQLCLKKYQFSCWLDKWKMNHIKNDDTYKEIKQTVNDAIALYENGIDYSNGALFYYSDIMRRPPAWTKDYEQVNKIGLHNFYAS